LSGAQGIHLGEGLPAGQFHESRAGAGGLRTLIAKDILQSYADRGIFRGFSPGAVRNGKATFKAVWFRNRTYEFKVDERKRTIACPVVLPRVDADLYAKLRDFLKSRQTDEVPAHRRIDPAKAKITSANKAGNVSVTLTARDADDEYLVRRFVNLINEIFQVFLHEHFDYQVAAFDLDPDQPIVG
jgi:hypothetical protein